MHALRRVPQDCGSPQGPGIDHGANDAPHPRLWAASSLTRLTHPCGCVPCAPLLPGLRPRSRTHRHGDDFEPAAGVDSVLYQTGWSEGGQGQQVRGYGSWADSGQDSGGEGTKRLHIHMPDLKALLTLLCPLDRSKSL